jgi:hypothetical protein
VTVPTIVLHIGAMKTGTSYLQSVLSRNAELLASRGVLWPGATWREQRQATQDLLATRGDRSADLGRWESLAEEMLAHDGPLAVVSMEFLSFASPEVAERAVAALAPARVRVVLGLRDLGRAIPAQWQESTQNLKDWTYQEYLAGLMAQPRNAHQAGRHFWQRQGWPRILRAWQRWVAEDDLVVMTVPASGAPKETLWLRFCEAVGLEPDGFDLEGFENDSLGAVSAELMRRVSSEAKTREMSVADYEVVKRHLAKQVLARRRREEPSIVLPPEHRDWVERASHRMLGEVREIAPRVVGDLDDLVPVWPVTLGAGTTTDPGALDPDLLVDAAVDGLLGLAARMSDRKKAPRRDASPDAR